MYIPLMKNRSAELRAIKKTNTFLSKDIFPLFEIIGDSNESNTERFNEINKAIDGKEAFIDLLRIDDKKYKKYDAKKMSLGLVMRDFDEYQKSVLEIIKYENFIPVISIRDAFDNNVVDFIRLYENLKSLTNCVAIRITADIISEYMMLITSLRTSDYLLFDIQETNVGGLSDEIEEIMTASIFAKKIILNSPRAAIIQNKDFEEFGITSLIDNSLLKKYKTLGFSGFGDYAGYKDVLPSSGGSNRGSALCLLYNYKENGFWVFTNKDTTLGISGYKDLIPKVLDKRSILDPLKSCLAYKKIESLSCGSYSSWIEICLVRYITQLYNNITDWN